MPFRYASQQVHFEWDPTRSSTRDLFEKLDRILDEGQASELTLFPELETYFQNPFARNIPKKDGIRDLFNLLRSTCLFLQVPGLVRVSNNMSMTTVSRANRKCGRRVSVRNCRHERYWCKRGTITTWWHHCSRCMNICGSCKLSGKKVSFNGKKWRPTALAAYCAVHAGLRGTQRLPEEC